MTTPVSHVEVSRGALASNIQQLRALCGPDVLLAPVVKANAYGHGLTLCAREFVIAGADWLCVNDLDEVERLRRLDLDVPIYLLGPTRPEDATAIARLGCHVVTGRLEHAHALAAAGRALGRVVPLHVKVETGTHRQGLEPDEALGLCQALIANPDGARLAGLTTHLADVEDETEHTFARVQLDRFNAVSDQLPDGILRHCASSAAQLLFPTARHDLVRPGIAAYGLWPSAATRISAEMLHPDLVLRPALSWKTSVVHIGNAARGDYVGYGRTLRVSRDSRIGLLPVGYYDGYDRLLSGRAEVLVRGQRARVAGRICMNMTMIDLTDHPDVVVGDPVTLLGGDLDGEFISADELANHAATINYEITTRIHERLPRIPVP